MKKVRMTFTAARRMLPLTLAVSVLLHACAAGAEPLRTPFEIAPAPPTARDARRCRRPAPPPLVALDVTSIYDQDDDSRSEIDPAQYQDYVAKMRAPRDFARDVVRNASDYTETRGSRLDDGVCALAWLESWAKGDALRRMETRQAALSATRLIAALSVAYLQVRDLAPAAGVDAGAIEAWLKRRADAVVPVFEASGARRSNLQNHRYWGGWAAAAAGVATGDRALLDWGIESYRLGACQVDAEGALPLELARGKRARGYHLHAIAPLVMIAELAEANGVDAYAFCNGAIHRLIAFALEAVADPARIGELAGAEQLPLARKDGHLRGDVFAWTEPYFKRFPERAGKFDLQLERPLYSTNLGGRITALFGIASRESPDRKSP
jgi:poly(beta-D-mannuronate) lyase